jgi:protein-tyrosine phosphatase
MQKIFYSFLCSAFLTINMKILFVCLGNICRSPAAEGIFKHLIAEHGLEKNVSCDSAGTSGWNIGDSTYPRMKNLAWKRGYRLDSIARQIKPSVDFEQFDLVIGMDDQNIVDLTRMAPTVKLKAKIHKMTDYCSRHKNSFVPDPYYGDTKDFELVLDLLEDGCEGLLKAIIQ